jgi:hypothetical protein
VKSFQVISAREVAGGSAYDFCRFRLASDMSSRGRLPVDDPTDEVDEDPFAARVLGGRALFCGTTSDSRRFFLYFTTNESISVQEIA